VRRRFGGGHRDDGLTWCVELWCHTLRPGVTHCPVVLVHQAIFVVKLVIAAIIGRRLVGSCRSCIGT
jgi:hypothetical protein